MKKSYETPELIKHGSIEELTRNDPTAGGTDLDFASKPLD
jgi:hypothetical protein